MDSTDENVIAGIKNHAPTAAILSMAMDDDSDSAVGVIEPPQTASSANMPTGLRRRALIVNKKDGTVVGTSG